MSVIIILGVIIDLVSKIIFANIFSDGRENIVVIKNFFEFTFVKNTGAAFGIFSDATIALVVMTLIFLTLFAVYDYFNHSNSNLYIWGFSLVISGAIGNLLDRLFLGYVRDFINIKIFSFIFNVADLFVTFGVIIFGIYLILSIVKEKKNKDNKNVVDSKK